MAAGATASSPHRGAFPLPRGAFPLPREAPPPPPWLLEAPPNVVRVASGRPSRAPTASRALPGAVSVSLQGRQEPCRRRRCGRPLPSPEVAEARGRCRVERRPPPAAARGPTELSPPSSRSPPSPPSSTCSAAAGSSFSLHHWLRGRHGARVSSLGLCARAHSGSWRRPSDKDSACGFELEPPEDAPRGRLGSGRGRNLRVWHLPVATRGSTSRGLGG